MLERCNGPECPRCGCLDTKVLETFDRGPQQPVYFVPPKTDRPLGGGGTPSTWWSSSKARCNFCYLVFYFREVVTPAGETSEPPVENEVPDEPPPAEPSLPAIEHRTSKIETPPGDRPVTECPACHRRRFWVYSTKPVSSERGNAVVQYRKCKDCGYKDDNKTIKEAG